MKTEIYAETEKFEHRTAGAHFINPCCFGEDFVAWITDKIQPLKTDGYKIFEPVQEDFGWGFCVTFEKEKYWITVSYIGDEPSEDPAQWVVSIDYVPGLNIIKRLFHKPDSSAYNKLSEMIRSAINNEPEIKVYSEEEWDELIENL